MYVRLLRRKEQITNVLVSVFNASLFGLAKLNHTQAYLNPNFHKLTMMSRNRWFRCTKREIHLCGVERYIFVLRPHSPLSKQNINKQFRPTMNILDRNILSNLPHPTINRYIFIWIKYGCQVCAISLCVSHLYRVSIADHKMENMTPLQLNERLPSNIIALVSIRLIRSIYHLV